MTQPVQEPQPERDVSALTWRTTQLARRPMPAVSAGTMPWARRSKGFDASNQSIGNNSFTDLTWNHDYNMGTGESGETYFVASSTTGLKVLVAGLYLITAEIYWFDTVNATWGFGISENPARGFSTHMNWGAAQNSTTQKMVVTLHLRLAVNTIIFATAYQLSGVNKNVDAGLLEAVYLGSYTGTERSAMDPDE